MADDIPPELFLTDDKKQWFKNDRFGINDASEVQWVGASTDPHFVPPVGESTMTLMLPVKQPDVVIPVVELILKDA
jgi:hypothetical protein